MKIKITGSLYEYWFVNNIGEIFEVIGEDVDSRGDKCYKIFHPINGDNNYYVPYYFCEVIE